MEQQDKNMIEGYKTYRHKRNPKEKEFHDEFLKEFTNTDLIVFGNNGFGSTPNGALTSRERRIVVSTVQWLGSPIGQSFLDRCGFVKKEDL
jgi:hypothetical protein